MPYQPIPKTTHAERTRRLKQAGALALLLVVLVGGGVLLAQHISAQQSMIPVQPVATTTLPSANVNAYGHISLIGKAAIVYDISTGDTLYAQNTNAQLPLASLTKLLTLYAASQTLSPNSPVVMSSTSVSDAQDIADIGFKKGETFNYQDLARLTLAASSNAGAEAIAEAASSARAQDTSSLLASVANSMGLKQTYANNGTGLDLNTEVSGGYGSVHDIAVLAGALLAKYPQITQASTLPAITAISQQGIRHTFSNTNIDVTHIPNLLLSKTGYTDLAGGNLVVVYDAGINHPIAVVVLGSTESGRFTDVQQLVAATQAHFAGITPSTAPAGTAAPSAP